MLADRRPYGEGRVTLQREAIADVAAKMPGAFSVEELAQAVRRTQPVAGATATVYRAVAAMESNGFLERVGTREGSALYTACAQADHHHHVVCEGCGRTAKADCLLEQPFSAEDGFVVTRHEVTLYGVCRDCAEKTGL